MVLIRDDGEDVDEGIIEVFAGFLGFGLRTEEGGDRMGMNDRGGVAVVVDPEFNVSRFG